MKHRSKQKHILPYHYNNNKLKEIDIKNCTCYYLDGIVKIYYLNNILLNEKKNCFFNI